MRRERSWLAALATLAIAVSGCVQVSTRADLAEVSALGRAPIPALAAEVAPGTEAGARELLRRPLTADASVRVALLNNRALRASLRELGVARGQLAQAATLPNPTLELDLRRRGERGGSIEPEISAEYELTRAILVPLRAGAARAELEAARYRSAAAVVDLGYEVRAAFLALQSAAARLARGVAMLDAFAAGRDASRALFDAGSVPELDFTVQEAAYQEARTAIAAIELEVLDRRESLTRLLGVHGDDTAWIADGTLPDLPESLDLPADLERVAITASLELAEMRSRLDGMARRAGVTRAEGWLPDVSVRVSAEQDGPGWTLGGGARVTLPAFDRREGAAHARGAALDAEVERYHGAAVDIRSAARNTQNRVASLYARARHLQEVVVPARRRVLASATLQYNAMQIGVFQLLQARRELLTAELGRVEALADFWTARAALDALVAGRRVERSTPLAPPTLGGASSEPSGGH